MTHRFTIILSTGVQIQRAQGETDTMRFIQKPQRIIQESSAVNVCPRDRSDSQVSFVPVAVEQVAAKTDAG